MSDDQPSRDGAQLFRPPVNQEIEKELEFHIAMRARELSARGKPAAEAERIARAELGTRLASSTNAGRSATGGRSR